VYFSGMPVGDGRGLRDVLLAATTRSVVGVSDVRQPGALGALTACAQTHIPRKEHTRSVEDESRTVLRPRGGDADRTISTVRSVLGECRSWVTRVEVRSGGGPTYFDLQETATRAQRSFLHPALPRSKVFRLGVVPQSPAFQPPRCAVARSHASIDSHHRSNVPHSPPSPRLVARVTWRRASPPRSAAPPRKSPGA